MRTKKLLFVLLITFILFPSCSEYSSIEGSGKIVSKVIDLSEFKGVSINNGIEAVIRIDSINKITIEADDNVIPYVKTEIKNSILDVTISKHNIRSSHIKVFINAKYIENVSAHSAANIKVVDIISTDYLKLTSSSGSFISITSNCKYLEANLSSGSSIKIEGKAEVTNIECSSGSSFDAEKLITNTLNFNASSGSNIKISVTDEIIGTASSGSSVEIKGNPPYNKVQKNSGAEIYFY